MLESEHFPAVAVPAFIPLDMAAPNKGMRGEICWRRAGMRAGLGSLIVAIAAYIFMGIAWLEHLIFTFPELLLIILALVVLAGRYTGYRLTELRRFREFTSN